MSIIKVTRAFLFFALIFCLFSNESGVPQGVTGSPLEANHNSCGTCHSGNGSLRPTISMEVKDEADKIVTSFAKGKTYEITVKVKTTGNAKGYGFQMSVIDSLNKIDLGNWSSIGEGVRQQNLTIQQKLIKYLVQSKASDDGVFKTKWKAPDTSIEKITFYIAGLAINGNGGTGGDDFAKSSFSFGSQMTSNTFEQAQTLNVKIYPNPFQNFIKISTEKNYKYTIIDLNGKTLKSGNLDTNSLDLSDCKSGLYTLVLFDQNTNEYISKRLVKY